MSWLPNCAASFVTLSCHSLLPIFTAPTLFSSAGAESSLADVALDPFHFGVRAAGLLHLCHTSVRSQFGFSASLQLTV